MIIISYSPMSLWLNSLWFADVGREDFIRQVSPPPTAAIAPSKGSRSRSAYPGELESSIKQLQASMLSGTVATEARTVSPPADILPVARRHSASSLTTDDGALPARSPVYRKQLSSPVPAHRQLSTGDVARGSDAPQSSSKVCFYHVEQECAVVHPDVNAW